MHVYTKKLPFGQVEEKYTSESVLPSQRNCSAQNDYIQQSDILKHKFKEKGYAGREIMEAFSKYFNTHTNKEDPPVVTNNTTDPSGPFLLRIIIPVSVGSNI